MQRQQSKTTIVSSETQSTTSTRESSSTVNEQTNEDIEESISIYNIILYGVGLAILCAISFGRTNDSIYHLTNMLVKAFVTSKTDQMNAFNDIVQNDGENLWKALQGPIFYSLYNTNLKESTVIFSNYGSIYVENRILGVARLRQVRVKPNSCELHREFAKRSFTHPCYAAYSNADEDRSAMDEPQSSRLTGDAWQYTPAKQIQTTDYQGLVSTYGGGGYVQLLTRNANSSMEILRELQRNHWINRGTRAIFFDVVVYNPNVNLFAHLKLLAEYPLTGMISFGIILSTLFNFYLGGVVPSTSIRAVKLIRYTSPIDYFTLVCEMIFMAIVIFQVLIFVFEILEEKFSYFYNAWNVINLISIILSFVGIFYEISLHQSTNKHLAKLLEIDDDYPNFDDLFSLKINSDFYLGMALAVHWLKIFQYLKLNPTLLLLNKTMALCLQEIVAFAAIFLIIFLAYHQLGWLLFGAHLSQWRSFRISLATLFRMMLGDFDLYALINIGYIVGPLFLFSYIYFVYFILLNMFLAIINEAYSRVGSDSTLKTLKIHWFPLSFGRFFVGNRLIQKRERRYSQDDLKFTLIKEEPKSNEKPSDINNKLSYDEYIQLDRQVTTLENQLSSYMQRIERTLVNLDTLR